MIETERPIARKSKIVLQHLNDEMLVYDLTTNKAVCLNETATQFGNTAMAGIAPLK